MRGETVAVAFINALLTQFVGAYDRLSSEDFGQPMSLGCARGITH